MLQSPDQALQADLRQWEQTQKSIEMVKELEANAVRDGASFTNYQATRVTKYLDDRAARRIAGRLVLIDQSERQSEGKGFWGRQVAGDWGFVWFSVTALAVVGLIIALFQSHYGAAAVAGALAVVCGAGCWWSIHRQIRDVVEDKKVLYRALTGRDLEGRASPGKVPSAAPEALP